jgi:enterochelin esterase family protein
MLRNLGIKTIAAAITILAGAATAVEAGTLLEDLTVTDPDGQTTMTYSVYLPEGAETGERRYPVVYLLHGYGASSREWTKGVRLVDTMERLVAEGRIEPMIAVMPDAGKSWYVDSARFGGPGNYESAIATSLVEAVDARFPTIARAQSRAVAGISMGGFGALRLAFKHPETFGSVAAFSAGLFKPDGVSWQHGPGGRRWESRHQWYSKAFGAPFSLAVYNAENPFTFVDHLQYLERQPDVILIVGDDDQMGSYDGTLEMFLALRSRGLKPELRVDSGGHDHGFWRQMVDDALLFLDERWREPAAAS